jgi:hypothetical protein
LQGGHEKNPAHFIQEFDTEPKKPFSVNSVGSSDHGERARVFRNEEKCWFISRFIKKRKGLV